MNTRYSLRRVKAAVINSWVILLILCCVTIIMVAADINGKHLVLGCGFLGVGIVGFIAKYIFARAKNYPIPLFSMVGSLCPVFIGYVLVMRLTHFMNIVSMGMAVVIWIILNVVQFFNTMVYEDELKEFEKE